MEDALRNSEFVLLVIAIGAVGLIAALLLARRSPASRKRRALLDYVLLWPVLFDKERARDPRRGDRLLTKREAIGWVVVIAIIVLAVTAAGRD